MKQTVTGKISVHPRGFGFLELTGDGPKAAFVAPPDLNGFIQGDEVRAELDAVGEGRFSARRLELVRRARHELFGTVLSRGGHLYLSADRQLTNRDWPLEASVPVASGQCVVARVEVDRVILERVVDAADAGLERVRLRHQIRCEWPKACDDEVERLRPVALEDRRDLRAMTTITIDAPSSKDLDDALSVLPAEPDGCVRVFVSIADVDAYVREGSALDQEARRRGTTVYLVGGITPMFPTRLCEELASLLPGVERPTLTVELRIGPEGDVRSVDLYASMIRSTARLDYTSVAEYLETGDLGDLDPAVLPTLRWLRTAAARLASVRAARGGVTLLRSEATVTIDELTGQVVGISAQAENEAHRLIERLMVAANEAVAGWLVDRGLPGVFRVHEAPDTAAIAELEGAAQRFGFAPGFGPILTPRGLAAFEVQFASSRIAPAVRSVLASALGPARYTVEPRAHFGLGAPLYLHFTSPIRRYADLAVHRVVKRFLAGDRSQRAGDPTLESLSRSLNDLTWRATKAEDERVRMIAARHLSGRVGERFSGNVVAAKSFGLVVQLSGTAITGTIQADNLPGLELRHVGHAFEGANVTYSVGDRLEVILAGTDEDLGRVDLVLEPRPPR